MINYSDVGIDIKKIKNSQSDIGCLIKSTHHFKKNINVINGFNHYAGIIKILDNILAMHTDGVGTKTLIATMMNKYDTIGIDCIAMNVNDVICVGATPISFVDYIMSNMINKEIFKKILSGIITGAKEAEIPVIGGETAIAPDLISGSGFRFDLAGTIIGLIKKKIVLGKTITPNDIIMGVNSSGLHSNGYSLVRKVLFSRYSINDKIKNIGVLGKSLLTPTKIYVKPVLEVINRCKINGLAHITGGSFTKLLRLKKIGFNITNMPVIPPIMKLIKEEGEINNIEMYKTFNMGIGFCIIAHEDEENKIKKICKKYKLRSQKIGNIINKKGVYINSEKIA